MTGYSSYHEGQARIGLISTRIKVTAFFILLIVLAFLFSAIIILGRTMQIDSPVGLPSSIEGLQTPLGVALGADGNLFVSDTGNSRVNVYDINGELLRQLGEVSVDGGDPIPFRSPYGIAVDVDNDKVYVCDYSVRVMDSSGRYLYDLMPPLEAITQTSDQSSPRPNGVALYQDRVYVTSRDGIYIFSALDGAYLTHWGSRGKEIGQYDHPNGIAIDKASGNIYVADCNNWRIVALTGDGQVRWVQGNLFDEDIPSPYHLPRSIAVGLDGLLYISDSPDRIVVLDQEGSLVSIVGKRGVGEEQLNFPEGLTLSSEGRIFVADRENNRVQILEPGTDLPDPSQADIDLFKQATKILTPATQLRQ